MPVYSEGKRLVKVDEVKINILSSWEGRRVTGVDTYILGPDEVPSSDSRLYTLVYSGVIQAPENFIINASDNTITFDFPDPWESLWRLVYN